MAHKLKGQNLRVWQGSALITQDTDCVITINTETEDVSTKDDVSMFDKEQVTQKSWQIETTDYKTNVGSSDNYQQLISDIRTFANMTRLQLAYDKTGGAANATAQNADFSRSGYAYLTDISIQMNNRQITQIKRQFTGDGALA